MKTGAIDFLFIWGIGTLTGMCLGAAIAVVWFS